MEKKIEEKKEVEVVKDKEIEVVETKVDGMKAMVDTTVVESQEDLDLVSDKIKNVKDMQKFIKQEMAKTIDPANAIIKTTKERFAPFLSSCVQAEADLKKKAEVYMLEQKKIEDEEKAKIASKVETGYIKPETAVEKMEAVPEAKKSTKTGASTLSMRMLKVPGAIDESLVPEEYWIPKQLDMKKITSAVKAGIVVAGVEVIEKPSMASR